VRRAGVYDFLARLASLDGGDLGMSDMRDEVMVGGWRA